MNNLPITSGSPLNTSSTGKGLLSGGAIALALVSLPGCGGGGGGGTPGSKPEFSSSDPNFFAVTLGTPEALCVQPGKPDGASITFANLPNGMTYNLDTNCLVVSSDVVGTTREQVYKFIQQATNPFGTTSRELTMSVNSLPNGTPTSKQIEPGKTTLVDLLEGITDPDKDMLNVGIISKNFQGTTNASCTDSCTIEDLFGSIALDQNGNLSLTPKASTQGVLKIEIHIDDKRGGVKQFTKSIQVVDSSQITAGLVDTNFSGTDTNPTISPFIIGNTDVISVTAVGLPNGITIDPNTREIKGTFIPKNPNGRIESYEVDFIFTLSSGAVLQKKVKWNFPTYFAASANNSLVDASGNITVNATSLSNPPQSKLVLNFEKLGFGINQVIYTTTGNDFPTLGASTTVSPDGKYLTVIIRSGAGLVNPSIKFKDNSGKERTITVRSMRG